MQPLKHMPTRRSASGLQSATEIDLHAKRQRALILEAERRQAEAEARLLNLEVAKRAALLILTISFVAYTVIGLLSGTDLFFWASAPRLSLA